MASKSLLQVKEQILTCDRCELSQSCLSPVPLSLPPVTSSMSGPSVESYTASSTETPVASTTLHSPRWAVLGEAPGQQEDKQGKPFVGPAGKFLRRTLTQAGLDPDEPAYLNAVSCYPNGTPERHHLDACRDNLRDQLASYDPRYVLVCGAVALGEILPRAILKFTAGHFVYVKGRYFFPVWHPSYLLRSGSRDDFEKWKKQLMDFWLVWSGWSTPQDFMWQCNYCNKRVWKPGSQACRQHTAKFRKDQAWNRTKPEQGTLP